MEGLGAVSHGAFLEILHGRRQFGDALFLCHTPTSTLLRKLVWGYTYSVLSRLQAKKNLKEDSIAVLVSVLLAWFLISSGVFAHLLASTDVGKIFESFVVGIFFTSAFTLAPAAILLAGLSESISPWAVALFGALGAMCGDLILFLFIRDRLAEDIKGLFPKSAVRRFLNSFHLGFWKWLSPILGALIIASPLPDEFGVSLLGLSRVRLAVLLPVAFVMNFLGILAIAGVASLLPL